MSDVAGMFCQALPGGVSARALGKAVQVDPSKATLKAPGTNLLTPKYDERLSNFAFSFNLRRYHLVMELPALVAPFLREGVPPFARNGGGGIGGLATFATPPLLLGANMSRADMYASLTLWAGAYTRPLSAQCKCFVWDRGCM